MPDIIYISYFVHSKRYFKYLSELVYNEIELLNYEYPDFDNWYHNKVITEIENGKRDIIIKFIDERIAGLSILKKTKEELKICTLRVMPDFRNQGLATELIKDSIDYLEYELPMITVSGRRHDQYKKLFEKFGFRQVDIKYDYYFLNTCEISYNFPIV